MRRVPIRAKLALALSVPLLTVGLVTLIKVANVAGDARDVRQQTELATATIGPNGLITALQSERNWTAAQLVGVDQRLDMESTGYEATRADTDERLAQFERELDRRGEAARNAYAPAVDGLAELDALRAEIDIPAASDDLTFDNIGLATQFFDRYTALIEPFFGGMSRISLAMDDPELRQGAELMATVTRQLETVPRLTNALVLPATVPTAEGDLPGIDRPGEIIEVAQQQNALRQQAEVLRSATGPYAEVAAEHFPETFHESLDEQTSRALTTGTLDLQALLSGLDVPSLDQSYLGYRDNVELALEARAGELNAAASGRQQRFALLMALILGSAVVLTVVVSLSITRPLRSLTRQAKEMAEERLPGAVTKILDIPLGEDVQVPTMSPVKVATRDEVTDVADALNRVQDSALDLAVEQAVLRRNIADSFVNLGRRNQNLLGRQLDFITELETNETDADTLASLFRLDHLATRMRRNAESLLVLAGIEPPRQWAAPVRMTDVIRAALGEVENYERVTVGGVEPATITGSAAADLAHLMAELIENALVFSPPDRSVDIRGAAQSHRRPGGYTLAVIDAGMGMSAQDMSSANRRLAGAESFTIAPSKYLGHYVAGNLAARHDIGVHLDGSPGSGVTALIDVPPELLTADGPPERAPLPVAPAPDPRRLAPAARPAVASGAPGPTGPTAAQLASLTHVADRTRTGEPARRTWPANPSPAPAPAPAPWEAPPQPPAPQPGHADPAPAGNGGDSRPPLVGRQRGAQMPTTTLHALQRRPPQGADQGGPPRPAETQGPPPGQHPQPAPDVYDLLARFTAGVQRGRDAARSSQSGWPPH